ncbi:hypothetical protein GTR04_3813 [Trichophyton interdigitale]|uniref:Uncharacterized protein n=1 Tax=Trichophyton interdigitale (strain MR816) TaxID=1215338 RepID=A0A059JC28_TRIIM|nr:hypothetical protein GY631_2042 [Trichophyton interdigitale]KAG5218710.1 hypothetical protein GY632_5281 [Trichophyton interdigitale]KAG8208781.1 hypothetical protein GTR04_3813 [Trichophyton interdigitale]KDB25188.1 hypothetical protein H109_02986 [Trichophyton interdigitale MR816]
MPAGLKLDGSVGEGKKKGDQTAPPLVDLTLDPWFVERRLVGRARNRSSPDDEEDEEEEEEEAEEAKKKVKSGGGPY